MDIKEMLKKFWFLAIVALGLLVYLIVYTVQAYQARPIYVDAKEVDGKSVVYTLNDENYYADDLYEDLYENYILQAAYFKWSKDVINKAIETTDDLSTYATNYAAYIQQANDEATIDSSLVQYGYTNGYDDLYQYCLDMLKADQLYNQFYSENYDTYVPNVINAYTPRKIYGILVSVENVESTTDDDGNTVYTANMTDEEQTKLDNVVAELKTSDFATVCAKYSDESSSVGDDGYFGLYDTQTATNQFSQEFSDTVLALETDTISDPILTEYGYYIVRTEEPTKEEILADTTFMTEVSQFYSYPNAVAVYEKSKEFGYEIVDEGLKERIDTYLALAEEELASYAEEINVESEVSE